MGSYGGGGDTVIQAPAAPNYQESMRDILKAQVEMAPQVYESEARYQPLYNALQAQQQAFQAQQSLNIARQAYPQVAGIEAAYNAANRAAELQQLQTALPQYQQAFNALTPGYAQAIASTGQLAQSAMGGALNRPQFTSFETGVRDPFGNVVATPVAAPVTQQAPAQLAQQPAAPQPQVIPRATDFGQAPQIQYDQAAENRFLQAIRAQSPIQAPLPLPTDPGPAIAPQPGRWTGYVVNQAEVDAQNAKIAQYQKDLAAYKANEAQRAAQTTQTLQTFDSAAAYAPQQQQAPLVAAPIPTQAPAQTQTVAQGPVTATGQAPLVAASVPTQAPAQAPISLSATVSPPPPQRTSIQPDLGRIDQGIVQQYVGTQPGMRQYADFLARSSQQELAAGRSLTPEEQRLADQSIRAAYAARGTALGNQAIAGEVLNRADVANQRYQQRLANAASAAQQIQGIYQPALQESFARQQAGLQYGLTSQQQAFSQAIQRGQAQQQAYMAGLQAQAAQAQLGAGALGQLQSAQAPVLQAFYKQPILQGQEGQAQQMGMAMQQQAGPQLFNPESQTGMGSIYGAYNAQMQLAGAQAQADAARAAGKSAMIGSIGGALLGAGGTLGAAAIL